jgi:folate-binding Fe-S cluster repair protein YgfZ
VGQETVARLYYRGKPNRHLRGLRLSGPAESGDAVRAGDRQVGQLGSVASSPRLGPIALAIVRREVPVGATVSVGDGETTAQVVELPFA